MDKADTGDSNASSSTLDSIIGQGIHDGALSTEELKVIY